MFVNVVVIKDAPIMLGKEEHVEGTVPISSDAVAKGVTIISRKEGYVSDMVQR